MEMFIMRGRKWKELMCLSVLLLLAMTPVASHADVLWTAYNDCHVSPLGNTQANVTTYSKYGSYSGDESGPLRDFATGNVDGMPTVTFTSVDTLGTSTGGAAASPAFGTDAYTYFFDDADHAIVDFSGNLADMQNLEALTITFSGLNPNATYNFIGTAIRNKLYPDRITAVTISGHDSSTENSSTGIAKPDSHTALLQAGNNSSTGCVVGWMDIACGSDGSFAITCERYSGDKAYSIAGFMLQETGTLGNQAPNVNAGDDQQITLPIRSVTMDAAVTDDGLGDPDGRLDYLWSKVSGPKDVEFEFDDELNPTVQFALDGAGVYVLRLTATDGEFDDFDDVTITVNAPNCPLGDLSGNCLVDGEDLEILGLQWLDSPAGSADLTGDDNVDNEDYAWVADDWRQNWQTGAVQVSIDPVKARGDGAQWRIVGRPSWHNHNDVESGLPTGTYTVEFRTISDWDKPNNQVVEVTYGAITQASGTYTEHTGSLRVNISPPDVLPTAKWRRVGETTWLDSGGTENNVPVGPQQVEFTPISGWMSPLPALSEPVILKDTLEIMDAVYADLAGVSLRINEFMAANSSTISDENNDFDDWIEIHNITGSDIDMAGMRLGHDADVLPIPTGAPTETTVPAGGYLIFWADHEMSEGPRHLDFTLDAGGDVITLYDTNGTTLFDSITFDSQIYNVSYGRFPDGVDDWYFFEDPTPNVQNDQMGIANRVKDAKFDPGRGFCDTPFEVTITTDTVGANIYFTTDSSNPIDTDGTPTGTLYVGPITISTTTCLRAAAVKAGDIATNIDTHTYIFLDDVLTQGNGGAPSGYESYSWGHSGSDWEVDPGVVNDPDSEDQLTPSDMRAIPTIVVCMPKDDWFSSSSGLYVEGVPDGTEYPCSFEYFDPDGNGLNLQQNCAMSMQGGISGGGTSLNRWKTDKLSNRPRFKTQTDNGTVTGGGSKLRAKIFPDSPVKKFDSIVLDGVLNHSWLHSSQGQRDTAKYVQDQAVADFHNAMMPGNSPHGAYAHVYLDNLYWGMYYIHERPDHTGTR